MTKLELRASLGLAGIYALRMLGMFLILPVFALYAQHLPGGDNPTWIGIALGSYGLTQALLQLPLGMLSDRIGRKKVIYAGLLVFAAGSFLAADADSLLMLTLGRTLQGAGAISAAVTALLADLTREEHRTKAMAMIGMTIGLTFAASLVLGPLLARLIGVPGIFALTGILSLLALVWVKFAIPDPAISRFHSDAEANPASLPTVLRDAQLLRLNFGIFALHAAQMAMFVVIPFALTNTAGLDKAHHWQVYLPVVVVGFILMVPAIIYGEKRHQLKKVFVAAIALMTASQIGLTFALDSLTHMVILLGGYFIAFNILEATLPSLISKIAPADAKGTAIGVYNTAQSLGLFLGAVAGGWLYSHGGAPYVFALCASLMLLWLAMALTMRPPRAVRTQMFHLDEHWQGNPMALSARLRALHGVEEAVVIAAEGVVYLKVAQTGWDEAGVSQSIRETQ
ncbi:hypothetical protein BXU06_06825 [Aquaspirillum sp. LM1]|uniref:MFS transporter n=1 Tax=Aquaspirillum sp. LM1 TaxID=1938604 RepID=UPI000983C3AC|nr:MFS transporter [Aquaspirillum sp. LM1]AQR64808.1 hypothetical protein BXU06_06825 [Aquaspirillum sp. LM1]